METNSLGRWDSSKKRMLLERKFGGINNPADRQMSTRKGSLLRRGCAGAGVGEGETLSETGT